MGGASADGGCENVKSHPACGDFIALCAAAYQGERVAARRLAVRAGLTEPQALHRILTQAGGVAGLAPLLAARAQLRLREEERRIAKADARAAQLALRKSRQQPQTGAGIWHAWFDGSAHPNPGRIGIGALLCGPEGERVEISRQAGHGNSGEAEYLALTALLEAALAFKPAGLMVHGDSQVVINDVTAAHTAAGARGLETHRARVLALLDQLSQSGTIALRWIPRHRNGAADLLSQQALHMNGGA